MSENSSTGQGQHFDLYVSTLFCGVAGLELPVESFEVAPGITLRQTYSNVIAPFLMAFKRPERPGQHSPGPLKVLQPGGFEVKAELELREGADALGFDRLNAVWFAVAMLRLRVAQPFQTAVIADRAFSSIAFAVDAAQIFPVELGRALLATAPFRSVSIEDLQWVKQHLHAAAQLMKQPAFNRAFQTIDSATLTNSPGAGIVIAWAAIETLVRPGAFDITKRLCKALSSFLYPPGSERDRAYAEIAECYQARGGAVHAGQLPDQVQFHKAYDLARMALTKAIQNEAMPEVETLLQNWREKQ